MYEMGMLYVVFCMIQIVLLLISYKSKYGFHLVYLAYLFLNIRNIIRVYDFEKTRAKLGENEWNQGVLTISALFSIGLALS